MTQTFTAVSVTALVAAVAGTGVTLGVLRQEYANQAWEAYNHYYPGGNADSAEWNVFRHAYVSARFTQTLGATGAQFLGDLNEAANLNNNPEARDLDYHSNDAGILIGDNLPHSGDNFSTDYDIGQEIYDGIQNDTIIFWLGVLALNVSKRHGGTFFSKFFNAPLCAPKYIRCGGMS